MSEEVYEIHRCEVCGNESLDTVLNLGVHPMCDDLVQAGDNRICKEYPIEILFCKNCNTAHQRFQVPKHDLFPSNYHYRSRFTNDVLQGMKKLVDSCIDRVGDIEGKIILDVGCNDGSLLDFFQQKKAVTYGIEPTNASIDAKGKGHIIFKEYLSEQFAEFFVETYGKPDIITFTNVFAHIEDLSGVLKSLKKLLKKTTHIIIENHYLGSVLKKNQFDTFYHEHPRTYSYTSFIYMANTIGLELLNVEFPSRYGGNIRIYMGEGVDNKNSTMRDNLRDKENQFFNDFSIMRARIESWQQYKSNILKEQFKLHGRIRAKAFPGRAAILVKMLGINEQHVSAVYEKPGSLKIGHYVPGTRIPIYSDDELFESSEENEPILNLAWHISDEIKNYLNKNGHKGDVIDILSDDDY